MARHLRPTPPMRQATLWFERANPFLVVGLFSIPGIILGVVLAVMLR